MSWKSCFGRYLLTTSFEELRNFLESAAPLHRGTRSCSSVLETPAVNNKIKMGKEESYPNRSTRRLNFDTLVLLSDTRRFLFCPRALPTPYYTEV